MEQAKGATPHRVRALVRAGLVAALVVGLMAAPVFAAKGGTNGTSGGGKPGGSSSSGGTISLALMDGATAAHFGARVTFNISTTATAYPYVHLKCYKGTSLVLEGWQGFFATALGNQWFYLGPTPSWSSGAGDCTATLEILTSKSSSVLASTPSFHVYE